MTAACTTCLFCRIVARASPAEILYETEEILAFKDIHPAAPIHALVVPKRHVARVGDADPQDALLLGHVLLAGAHVARQQGIATAGYRLVFNNGRGGGEHVAHVHLHVLGGRPLRWPPG